MSIDYSNNYVVELEKLISRGWNPTEPILFLYQETLDPRCLHNLNIFENHYNIESIKITTDTNDDLTDIEQRTINTDINMFDSPTLIKDKFLLYFKDIKPKTLIIDITCIPTRILLPIIKILGWDDFECHNIESLITIYTKPNDYELNLGRGFSEPEQISNFNFISDNREIGWIPILGFDCSPTLKVQEDIVKIIQQKGQNLKFNPSLDSVEITKNLLSLRTYPIIGWPPYRSDFYNRSIWENERLLIKIPSPPDKLKFTSADDPFYTAQTIKDIVNQRPDLNFICSPQGSQPMNLGAGLACASMNLRLLHSYPARYKGAKGIKDTSSTSIVFFLYS